MTNAYRDMMSRQSLSKQARQEFYDRLQRPAGRRGRALRNAAALAACIALLIPVTVYAVEAVFGVSIVELVISEVSNGGLGKGYEISYPDLEGRPLSDFSEDIRNLDGVHHATYHSWAEAEQAIGVTLVENSVLHGEGFAKEYVYNLRDVGIGARAHCYTTCSGLDDRLYRATITAAYSYNGLQVTLRSTVTCEHPAISKEKEHQMHWTGVLYENKDVDEITQEQYTAENGIVANIVTVRQSEDKGADYEATFAANGASYGLTVGTRGPGRDAEAKEALIKILEGFSF